MKRKRGHKKGKKSKKSKSESIDNNVENQTSEQSYEAPVECENSEHETKMEVEAPSSTGSGNSPNAESVDADKNAVAKSVGRVKVKLKSSKAPEPDEKSRNDVDKSSSQVVSEVPVVVVEKKEEFVPRLPERRPLFLNVYRKTKGIKIKSSKAVEGSSSSVTEKVADAVKVPDAVVIHKDTKTVEEKYQANKKEPESVPISVPKEEKKTDQSSRYNKQELEDSLTVIKKIMKLEAADPFNVPVNPEALGIPVIKKIMKMEAADPFNVPVNPEALGIPGSEEEIETPLKPLRMYFPPSEYKKKIKLSTRCFIHEALKTLDGLPHPLTMVERKWFEEHPQFQHIFHMPRDKNHKVMGMWMLFLRTTCIEKEKEAWFVVNGTPIRYGIKEHALISGLNCRNYPLNYNKAGSEAFVNKHFKGQKTIRYQDVKAKLEAMVPREFSQERLKMVVLYFLSSIVIAQTKTGENATPVEAFFLRAVDDLNFCKKFPWGRLSFDHMLKEIKHTMTHFGGAVKEGVLWPVPGFCIPMELLAFEAIPELGNKFREDYPGADANCPRMCRRRWKKGEMKGFSLSKINKELGTTVDIDSILVVRDGENSLLAEITEKDDDDDKHDVVVNSWMHRLSKGHTVSFEEMYNQDVASRLGGEEPEDAVNEEIAANERSGNPTMAEMVDLVNTMKKEMEEQRKETAEMVDGFGRRLASLEALVKEQVRQASADPSEDDIAGSTEPPNNQSGPSP